MGDNCFNCILLINHIALLFAKPANQAFSGPFYNSFHHSVPFIGFAIVLLYALSTKKDFSLDKFLKNENELSSKIKDGIVFFIARIFIGVLFFAQGLELLTGKATLMSFAENVYVKSYDTTFIPTSLLWFMGLSNPWILCICGALLTLGLKTKWIVYLLSFFMVSIVFGHLLDDPFETSGSVSMYGFNNLAFVLLVMWLENGQNKYSIDRFLHKKLPTT